MIGRSLAIDETLAEKLGLDESADSGRDSNSLFTPPVGANSFTIACSMAGRTLKFFNCFFKSDFAALGASL